MLMASAPYRSWILSRGNISARVRRHALALLYAMLKQRDAAVHDQELQRQCKSCLKKTLVDMYVALHMTGGLLKNI